MEEVKQTVEMTAEERQEYEAFKAAQAEKKAREQAKRDREAYKDLVDETIERVIPSLQCLSQGIKDTKLAVLDDFRSVIDMKSEVLKLKKDGQRSDTFTNSAGDKRITVGVYTTDGYRDTVEDGIAIVKEYIEGLASDEKTKALVKMVNSIEEKKSSDPQERMVGIAHCNCPQRAEMVKEEIIKRLPFKDVILVNTAGVSSMYANDGGVIMAV